MAELLERRELLATFQPGDIVVEQVGDGTTGLTPNGNAIFLNEYTPTGTLDAVDRAADTGRQR